MELLYQTDSYMKEIDTEITRIDPGTLSVQFAATIVYPGGGGQPYDVGNFMVNDCGHGILGASKNEAGIWYRIDPPLPAAGEKVRLQIDWDRRYALMRTHTGMHILCGVIWKDYGKAVTGGNMEPLKARMDFDFEGLNGDLLREIEAKVNAEVLAARNVVVSFLDREAAVDGLIRTKENLIPEGVDRVRLVEIEGLDKQADGGTHVRNTKEVGTVRIVGFENKGKNNKRIKIELE
jgi:misacylated tRNA(Ala) deacylase